MQFEQIFISIFVTKVIESASWLDTVLYENMLLHIDLWTFTKCWIGFALYFLMRRFKLYRPLLGVAVILLLYEIFETIFQSLHLNLFLAENWQNHLSDLLIGILGGIFAIGLQYFIQRKPGLRRFQFFIIAFICGASYSFTWVGFYQYQYNMTFFNTPGINFGAFLFWLAGSWGTIEFFRLFKKRKLWLRLLVTWATYIICLFMFEFIAYELVEIHEVSRNGENPLLFGLIHGTWYLHLVYLLQPLISISLYLGFSKLIMNHLDYQFS